MDKQQLTGPAAVGSGEAPSAPYPRPAVIVGGIVGTGLALLACSWLAVPWPIALAQLGALLVAIAAAVIDARQLRLPDWLTYPLAAAGVIAAAAFQLTGQQHGLVMGLIGGAGYGLILLALALLVDVRMYGLGDVKLAAGLGIWLGSLSLDHLFVGFIAAQVMLLICVLADRVLVQRVRAIPAGPALVAGAIIGILVA